ncbi:hypothetical protein Sked_11830 [Sanguibacter keddieii DSM 10542]|uniref:Uncharacterized protein n=1 Tax=Sanguibacter keddieii (strain ATCC 51767 / DSM 10542 / NCFB 3025 / ST-74) TaxID=446469 RepID=D1BDR4_SANKS|nr:hypothetical protein [Sanguibacter keddieii]ACZ21126.1 hypothetical protein Sked_11830 [Sanguibacter keddieii DSM 10542]
MNESIQQNAVQQGLAVSCRALGITEITAGWDEVKHAFRRAWSTWDRASELPAIRCTFVGSSIHPALVKSASRPGSLIASWDCEGSLRPVVRDDLAPGALPDLLALLTGVRLEDWIELTRSLVASLDDADVIHVPAYEPAPDDRHDVPASTTPAPAI